MILGALLLAASAPTIWSKPPISSDRFESHPAFDPLTGDLWFVRSSPEFRGWRLKISHCGNTGWDQPVDAPIAGDGVEADPWFSSDGRTLWFISTRSTDGIKRKDLDIWRVTRGRDGKWGTPERLPEPLNSTGQEWFPRPAPDGWLYFGSDRPGGFGKTDIWRARQDASGQWKVENAGAAINTADDEYEPLPSPDGKRMIVSADALYVSKLENGHWMPRVKLGPDVNANGSEIGAAFSPSGKSLLFARDTKGPLSGEFYLWQPDGPEAWPPVCGGPPHPPPST
jgi:hypothetical protein